MLLTLISLVPELDLPLAHETDMPHEEKKAASGDNAGAFVIVGVVFLTLVLLGALIWLKERTRRAEAEPPVTDS